MMSRKVCDINLVLGVQVVGSLPLWS